MTPEELSKWKEEYGHLSQATMDNSANLRFASCDAELDLGRLYTKKGAGDYVWFILTDGASSFPLQRLLIMLCTPEGILLESHVAGGESSFGIIDSHCPDYLTHLKLTGWRKLTDDEFTVLTSGST
jgi:hypothetical protein